MKLDVRFKVCFLFMLALAFCCVFPCSALQAKVWRIAYVEGGPLDEFGDTLKGTASGLKKLGIIKYADMPRSVSASEEIWAWLSEHAGGKRISFLRDGFYSAGWDARRRVSVKESIKKRIREQKDIDIVIAMGTRSSIDMTEEDLGVPVFCMDVSSPVEAGIVKSAFDSGKDNVHVLIDAGRSWRQLQVFHDLFHFGKLGIAYEDTEEGRNSVSLTEIELAARSMGITLLRATAPIDLADLEQSFRNMKKCIDELCGEAEAILLVNSPIPFERTGELLELPTKIGIPTFAQADSRSVKHGALLSLSQTDFDEVGLFEANAIACVINGALPREVNQIFSPQLGIAVNLEVAVEIGWTPPLDFLTVVDEIYP